MTVKPNIDNYKFTDYRNPDAYFGGEMPERGTYRKALKSVADEIEQQARIAKKTYWGATPPAKQFRTELNNIWGHSSVRDTLSPAANSQLEDQPELLQAVNDVRKYGQDLLKELEPLTQWNGKEWVEPVNESIINKLRDVINEAEENEAKYYYIVDANYSVPGHYWNDDIKAYTPEGDRDEYDGQETSKLYTWDDLLWALDDEYLLTDDVPDEAPTEIIKEENGNKILLEYNVEREQEWDDEEGHFEIRYYNYEVQICIKE